MLEVKEYIGTFDNTDFYQFMGKFFAERIYRRELPYLVNDQEKIWYLFFDKSNLVGFVGIVMNQNSTAFTDFYILHSYRNDSVRKFMSEYMLNLYKTERIRILTNSEEEMKMWEELGFLENGNKGSYTAFVYGEQHASEN